ncbi:uncharacterized protein [Antedon mediterranea]|uniref:uncharacterized protein n=1 Tax=Antedon mediterranea TaxID=105859 RepID=UPI003AF72F11
MRFRAFTFFLSIIILLTVLNIIFVYESTRNSTYDVKTKQHERILAEHYAASKDIIHTFFNDTQFRSIQNDFDAFMRIEQRNNSLNVDAVDYIPVENTDIIKLSFQDLFELLVNNTNNNNSINRRRRNQTSNLKHFPFKHNMSKSIQPQFKAEKINVSSTENTSLSLNETYVRDLIKKTVKWYHNLNQDQEYNHHCRSCALVTSSGRLLNQSSGSEIDSAECVIRMNDAPVIGFVNDVGNRTDIRVMGHPNLATLKKNPENLLEIFHKSSTKTKFLLVPWLYNTDVNKTSDKYYGILRNLTRMFPDVNIYVPSKDAMDAAESIFEFEIGLQRSKVKTWFTTGWQTMLLSISICDRIKVYGMPQVSHCSNSSDRTPYHYYNEHGKRECDYYMSSERRLDTGHIFLTEKAVFSRWAHKFNITFHTPSWNMTFSENGTLDTPFIHAYNQAHDRISRIDRERKEWRERIRKRRERNINTPTEEPLYFLLFSVTLLVVVLKGCDILTFIVTLIVPESWQNW